MAEVRAAMITFGRMATILIVLALVIGPAAAQASSVTVSGGVMTITANPGEANRIDFSASGSDTRGPLVRVEDPGSSDTIPNATGRRIVAGGSCDQDSSGRHARCPTDGLTRIVVDLGDLGDTYDGENMAFDTELELGPGDDTGKTDRGADLLRGSAGRDTLNGGRTPSGSGTFNTLDGGTEDDTFDIGTGSGTDIVNGGGGSDTASYRSRSFASTGTTGVTVTFDDTANDGFSNEDDNIRNDIEKVVGSRRNDFLRGNANANILEGELGRDSFTGNGGADTYLLRDGEQDNGFCIDANDTVDKDLKDPRILLPCAFLELSPNVVFQVFTGAVNEGPNVRVASRRLRIRRGRVRVALACPRALGPRRCAGRLAIRDFSRSAPLLARARYRLRSGRRRVVSVRLRKRAQRRARRGTKGVILEAVETGEHGLKTTYAVRHIR